MGMEEIKMKDELQNFMEQPKRYDNIDGTGEMFMGLMLLGFALLGYLQTALHQHSMWRYGFFMLLFMFGIMIPVMGLGFVIQRVVKKYITWPRTGYVAYNPDRKTFRKSILKTAGGGAIFGVAFGVGFACMLGLAKSHPSAMTLVRWIYLGFWVPIYAFWVLRLGREHSWKWLIVLFMALGLVAIGLIVPGGFIELTRTVALFVGLVWLISGVGTLISYIRRTQPPVGES
jgi:MFS family permease